LLQWQNRLAVQQYNVAAHPELRPAGLEIIYSTGSIIECSGGRHNCGGRYDSLLATFDNGTIDARGHSEIVGIDDESAHGFSVASKKMGPRQRPPHV
jgi:hypothetical protein